MCVGARDGLQEPQVHQLGYQQVAGQQVPQRLLSLALQCWNWKPMPSHADF